MDKIEEVLTRRVDQILPDNKKLEKLLRSKKIRVYLGVDPTGPRLHLGHSIGLRKLQEFANLGHEAILLFGTGTVLAGDPSQRVEKRKRITSDEVKANIKTWKTQAQKILDFSKISIKFNGDWLLKLSYADILNIASNVSAAQLFKRDMFQDRLKRGDTVWTHELLYPLLQGYDSVKMDVDLEIGGTDQTFNMLMGRELQKKMNGREKFVLTTPLISGTDGNQMTKTTGNCIWLDDSAQDIFGKIMSMADSQITEYWNLLTSLKTDSLDMKKPLETKKRLAFEIISIYFDKPSAIKARNEFENIVQKGHAPKSIDNKAKDGSSLLETVASLVESKSQAKRLLESGAVEIDGKVIKEGLVKITIGQIIKIGKKTFAKVVK